MPKRSSKALADDRNDTPLHAVREKNPAAVALGRLGGKKGGPARAAKLSASRRKSIARKAAEARWKRVEIEGEEHGE